jgi:hypothetical protein
VPRKVLDHFMGHSLVSESFMGWIMDHSAVVKSELVWVQVEVFESGFHVWNNFGKNLWICTDQMKFVSEWFSACMNMWMADSFYFYALLDQRSLCLMQRWAEVLFSMVQNPRLQPISKRSCILAAHAHEGCLEKSLVNIETNQQTDLHCSYCG